MVSLTKYIVLITLSSAAVALTSPHVRNAIHHRAIVARAVAPPPVDVLDATPRKRSLGKRCKSNNGTATSASSYSSPSPSPSPSSSSSTPTSTPVNVAPEPSVSPSDSTSSPLPTPTPVQHSPSSSSSSASNPAHTPVGFLAGPQTGDGTYYATGTGSCGWLSSDTDFICAVSMSLYDIYPGYILGNPNNNPVCGQMIKATYQGKSIVVKVVDRCEGCSETSLDFSPSAFKALVGDLGVGRIKGMVWEWVS